MLEELAADGPDPVFREGVDHRCPDGRPKDLESFGPEDLVEGVDELAAPVTNQSPSGAQSIAVVEEQVAGGLGVQKLRPGDFGSLRSGFDAVGLEDLPHGGRGKLVAEVCEFAVDTSVAPGRVLAGKAEDESSDLDFRWWSTWSSVGLCPVASNASSVPTQECVWGDEPAVSSWPRERGSDDAEQDPVVIVNRGTVVLSAENSELVTEHDDLEVFGAAGAHSEPGERGEESIKNTRHSRSASAVFPLISVHDRIFGPHSLGASWLSANRVDVSL